MSLRRNTLPLIAAFSTAVALVVTTAPGSPASGQVPSELLFTQYVEGSGFNKAIEIANGSDVDVSLDGYLLELYSNGSATPTTVTNLTGLGSVLTNDVFVLRNSQASQEVVDRSDAVASAVNWNGDDAVVLRAPGGAVADSLGQVGVDPGTAWSANGVSTLNDTLCRLDDVTVGDTDPSDVFDPSEEWTAIGLDVFTGLGEPGCDTEPPGPPVARFVHEIQGTGTVVALPGPAIVQAVVVGLFQDDDALDGFFLQEEDADADADPLTSEGIFVFCRGSCPAALTVGDLVTVQGQAEDFFGMTQIDATGGGSVTIDSSQNPLPALTPVSLPASGATDAEGTFEAVEGMLVQFPDQLAVSEYFELARFGHLVLTLDQTPFQFTHSNEPSEAGYQAFLADLATRRIFLDDDNNDQNDALGPPDEPYYHPIPGLSTGNRFRGGDTITGLTGVMHWSFAGAGGTDAWRVRPVTEQFDYSFTPQNPRPATPGDVGGELKVSSFNVLNYFTTIDDGTPICGPGGGQECRGADSQAELARQRDKIVSALGAIDADVVGVIEIENNALASLQDLVDGLNSALGAGSYHLIDTGTIGTDAIKVGLMYRPDTVAPVGPFAILDSSDDPRFLDTLNRPVLIQTFEEVATQERFTVAVNHLKSKGSDCDDVGDPDAGDGQGNCNGTRTDAAAALVDHLATDPTGSGDPDFLIIGDLNAYAMEDPVDAIEAAGYTDLVDTIAGPGSYSFLFDGQLGYLDHALASDSLRPQVTGLTGWHVNADEVPVFDYNDDVEDGSEAPFERESSALPIYEPDPFRSSDHDPVIVGLDLTSVLSCAGVSGTAAELEAMGFDVHLGTGADDVITANQGRDFVLGLGGDDVITTGNAADVVCAGDGDDQVTTGNGPDVVDGGAGNDTVDTGNGPDTVIGSAGNDMVVGGSGSDTLSGGGDDDHLSGDSGADSLSGGDGSDTCDGGTGPDSHDGTCEVVLLIP